MLYNQLVVMSNKHTQTTIHKGLVFFFLKVLFCNLSRDIHGVRMLAVWAHCYDTKITFYIRLTLNKEPDCQQCVLSRSNVGRPGPKSLPTRRQTLADLGRKFIRLRAYKANTSWNHRSAFLVFFLKQASKQASKRQWHMLALQRQF